MTEAYNIDCMEFMRSLPDKAFDLAVVDPPYGIGVMSMNYTKSGAIRTHGHPAAARRDYRKQSEWDVKPTSEYFAELRRVSKKQIVWGGELPVRQPSTVKIFYRLGQARKRFNDK